MLYRLVRYALAGAAVLAVAGPASSQEYEAPEMYWVYREYVKPGQMEAYEAAAKDMIKLLGSTEASAPVSYMAVAVSDFSYAYVIPIEGLGGLDKAWKDWGAAVQAAGPEKFAAIEARSAPTVRRSETSVIVLRPDLSRMVEETALTAERPFRAYHFFYAIPGKEKELESAVKEMIALHDSKGIEHGWRIYQTMMGADLPLYIGVETAADEAAYHATMKKVHAKLGEQGERLHARALKAARRIDRISGWIRPDLSFPPTMATSRRE